MISYQRSVSRAKRRRDEWPGNRRRSRSTATTDWDRDAALTTARILLEIQAINFRPEEPYTFTSGWKSPVYIDCRRIIFFPRARSKICELGVEKINRHVGYETIEAVAGGETAGIPFAAWIADRMLAPMAYVRKQPKGFGRNALIEGDVPEGKRTLLVEDLTTDGQSKIRFAQALRDAGAIVQPCVRGVLLRRVPRRVRDAGADGHRAAPPVHLVGRAGGLQGPALFRRTGAGRGAPLPGGSGGLVGRAWRHRLGRGGDGAQGGGGHVARASQTSWRNIPPRDRLRQTTGSGGRGMRAAWLIAAAVPLFCAGPVQAQPAPSWPHSVTGPNGASVTVYQPQAISWPEHKTLATRAAIAITPKGAKTPTLGTVEVSFATTTDPAARSVTLDAPTLTATHFPSLDTEQAQQLEQRIKAALPAIALKQVPLDTILLGLKEAPQTARPVAVNNDPPVIFHSDRPASLVVFDGDPVLAPAGNSDSPSRSTQTGTRSSYPGNGTWYLLNNGVWLAAQAATGPYKPVSRLPPDFSKLPADANFADARKAMPPKAVNPAQAPTVFASTEAGRDHRHVGADRVRGDPRHQPAIRQEYRQRPVLRHRTWQVLLPHLRAVVFGVGSRRALVVRLELAAAGFCD